MRCCMLVLVNFRWNPAAEAQALDRTHRLGQHKPIKATRFIIADTVEERIVQLQVRCLCLECSDCLFGVGQIAADRVAAYSWPSRGPVLLE